MVGSSCRSRATSERHFVNTASPFKCLASHHSSYLQLMYSVALLRICQWFPCLHYGRADKATHWVFLASASSIESNVVHFHMPWHPRTQLKQKLLIKALIIPVINTAENQSVCHTYTMIHKARDMSDARVMQRSQKLSAIFR